MTGRVKPDRLYKEHVIQRLLDAAERLMWELADEEGNADLVPSLGSVEAAEWHDQRRWAPGGLRRPRGGLRGRGSPVRR